MPLPTIADALQALSALVTLASIIAALTPTPTDNAVLAVLRKLVDFAAFNWGHAANARKAAAYDAEHAAKAAPAPLEDWTPPAERAENAGRAERLDR